MHLIAPGKLNQDTNHMLRSMNAVIAADADTKTGARNPNSINDYMYVSVKSYLKTRHPSGKSTDQGINLSKSSSKYSSISLSSERIKFKYS